MAQKQFDGFLSAMQGASTDDASHESQDMLLAMVRYMAQSVFEEEMTRYLGAECSVRTPARKGYRNGYKPRTLNTRVGKLSLSIPQARNTEPYEPFLFSKWQRSERALLVACAEMYFMGVSTRKVGAILEKMGGFELSAGTVSRVAMELDERLTEFRNRRLEETKWPFLVVDACYVKVRRNGSVVSQAVLVVAGIKEDGRREILTWQVGDVESEETWTSVFRELRQRGINGVEWVVSDGHTGIQAAVSKQFPGASWQRCWAHFIRGTLAKVSHKHKDALAQDLIAARKFDDVKTCMAEAERVALRWEQQYPRVATQIREQFEETLAVHRLAPVQRRRVYTSNMLERIMREIKRRTRVVGIFPNVASCDRLVGAQLIEIHESWHCETARYLTFDQPVSVPMNPERNKTE